MRKKEALRILYLKKNDIILKDHQKNITKNTITRIK